MQSYIDKLKREYIEYFKEVPVQKYAAMAIGRDEDTIIRWRKSDKYFAESVQKARAEFIRKKVTTTKAEFALERLESEIFGTRSSLSIEQRKEYAFNEELSSKFTEFLQNYTKPS